MDIYEESAQLHEKHRGKISLGVKTPIKTTHDLSLAYTPGVAEPCRRIAKNPDDIWKYTNRRNTVAVVTDGTAVLGLGDIGPEAALPVMSGKAVLFKQFGDIDAFPICLNTTEVDEIVETVVRISPGFGGINLEDISAPRCFEIERRLDQELSIPVFHDDQHGTAIVAYAALINSLALTGRELDETTIVVSGTGAAGVAIIKMLLSAGSPTILTADSKGIIHNNREDLNESKRQIAEITNPENSSGPLARALANADVFIGVSVADLVTAKMVSAMAKDPIVIAMANPRPEIMPTVAKQAGAAIVATGRSDFPNQVNNVLAFPGIFRGALDCAAPSITDSMKIAAARALAGCVKDPSPEMILPSPLDTSVAPAVAAAVQQTYEASSISAPPKTVSPA